MLLCTKDTAGSWGGKGGFAGHPLSAEASRKGWQSALQYIAFKIWKCHPSEVRVCWWGAFAFSSWLSEELWMFYEGKGKNSWGVLISSSRHWVVYSQWNPCSWPRTEGTAFSYTGLGGIWKWVKEIHVWACARWFCCLCGCFYLPMFGLSSALLRNAFDYFTTAFDFSGHSKGMRLVLVSRAVKLSFALIKCSVYEYLRVDYLRINWEFLQ